MKNKFQTRRNHLISALAVTLLLVFIQTTQAQTTAFNFQGRLNDGTSPANGRYDLQFRLYDALTGDNQIGAAITKANTTLVNGVFSTQLDFGANAFNGADRFMEIRLRSTGTENGYVILGPRQQILSVPYTIRSGRATLANDATHAVNADNAGNSLLLGGVAATNYLQKSGDGSQLANVTAVNSQQLGGKPLGHYVQVSDGVFIIFNGNDSSPTAFGGNVMQAQNVNGLPKAILAVDRDGNITSCYNGITGASTGGCGFSTTHTTLGAYTIDFGFNILQRAIVGTSGYDAGNTVLTFLKGYTPQANSNAVSVRVTYIHSDSEVWRDHVGEYTNAPFSIVVY